MRAARTALACIVLGLLISRSVAAQNVAGQIDELETAVVTGEHPGPGLWKVSRGEHVMWVLGTHAPLPKGMTWRSQAVEARIAESQVVLIPGAIDIDLGIGFFRTLSLIPAMLRAVRLPDRKTLRDVLPAATWQKWRGLREKFGGRSDRMDRLRPMFAIEALRDAAYARNRLTDGPVVDAIVKAAAKKRKVRLQRLRDPKRSMKIGKNDMDILLNGLRELPDVQCFSRNLEHFDADVEQLKALANAWARGNIAALRELHGKPEVGSECDNTFEATMLAEDSPQAARMKQLEAEYTRLEAEARAQLQTDWIAAARKALEKNRSTVAILPMREVVRDDGAIAKLKELGYEVEGP